MAKRTVKNTDLKTIDKIKEAMPKDRDFRAMEVAQIVFPNHEMNDTEGRCYNMGVATTARLLRKIKGVIEITHGVFYAHSEYF